MYKFLIILILCGCGEIQIEPEKCNHDNINGVYLIRNTQQNGSCNEVEDYLAVFDTGNEKYPDSDFFCTISWEYFTDETQCQIERCEVCWNEDTIVSFISAIKWEQTMKNARGKTYVMVTTKDETPVCESIYSVAYIKQ